MVDRRFRHAEAGEIDHLGNVAVHFTVQVQFGHHFRAEGAQRAAAVVQPDAGSGGDQLVGEVRRQPAQ